MNIFNFFQKETSQKFLFEFKDTNECFCSQLNFSFQIPDIWTVDIMNQSSKKNDYYRLLRVNPPMPLEESAEDFMEIQLLDEITLNDHKMIDWSLYFPFFNVIFNERLLIDNKTVNKVILNHQEDNKNIIAYCLKLKDNAYLMLLGVSSKNHMKWYKEEFENIVKSLKFV